MNATSHALPLASAVMQQTADISENIVLAFNKHGTATYFNKAWLDYRGASLEDERQSPWNAYVHGDDLAGFQHKLVHFCRHHQPDIMECRLLGSQGTYSWFRFILSPLLSGKGAFQGGFAYGHDISDAKRMEDNAHKFLAIFSTPSAGIIIKDREGRIVDWNPGSQNIMGYHPQDMIGQTSDSYTCQTNVEAIAEINQRLVRGETTSFTRTEVNHKKGHKIICSTSFCPIQDSAREFAGSVVIFHDVTAEKLAEQKRLEMERALQKSHKDIATILNEIPAPICVVEERSGAVLSSNAAFATMCGASMEQLAGTLITKAFFDENGHELTVEQILDQLRKDKVVPCHVRKQGGTLVELEIMGRQLVFQDTQAIAIHCMDLTARRIEERAMSEAVQAAEDASRMKSTFLANMSHEIRTPLNGVVGFAELALDEVGISAGVRNWLDKIKLSANGLLEIINDILDISKIEAGKIELEKNPFSLHDILHLCETIVTPKAEEKNVTLYLYAEPLVNRRFVGDQTRLRQILLNLLSNAIKFTNVGIVKLMSNVEELGEGKVLLSFEVKDSGIGMTAEQVQKIFEPFAQADSSTTRKYGGTGLGLAITKNLVEIMGGTLQVESAPGIGSKFCFALPFDTVADAPSASPHTTLQPSLLEKPKFSGRVLVCEDNPINQQVIQEHLSRVGLDVLIMPNGKLGVEQVKSSLIEGKAFDLILMDIHMPVMDGLEATQKLLDMNISTPIVALTANAMSSDRKNYLNHGMSDYLAKPFRAQELWECLLRHLTAEPRQAEAGAVVDVGQEEGGGQADPGIPGIPGTPGTLFGERGKTGETKGTGAAGQIAQAGQTASPRANVRGSAAIFGSDMTVDSRMPSASRSVPATSRAPFSRPDDDSSDTAIIDRMRGIENAAGNTGLYTRLLGNFLQDNADFIVHFEEALDAGNRGLAHRMAHTLKGVAGTIGAMHLYAVARTVESALNEGRIKEVKARLAPLKDAVLDVLSEISNLDSASETAGSDASGSKAKGEACASCGLLNPHMARELIDRLEPLLEAGDSESLEFLDAINSSLSPLGEAAQGLAEQISEYDFEAALETLTEIKKCLESCNE